MDRLQKTSTGKTDESHPADDGRPVASRYFRWGVAIITSAATFGWLSASTQELPPLEYRVKAAFLYNFAQFVEWPAGTFTDTTSPIVIGVLGKDPFGVSLEQTVEGNKIGGRVLVIRRYAQVEDVNDCHLLFIAESGPQSARILQSLADRPILTVGESDQFLRQGGAINFVMEANKVRFEINMTAATRAQLKISARLLSLARKVIREAGEGQS